jgi:predicted RNA-binding protein with PUA-like domain
MARWLLKEEPDHYSWADLVRDGSTSWDGVHNALALRYLRAMAVGDPAFFYHTGEERALVGIVEAASAPRPDPDDPRGSWSIEVRPVRPLKRPVRLAELRTDRTLAGFDLLRLPRLSVVPVSEVHWRRLLEHESRPLAPEVTGARAGSTRTPAPRRPGGARRRRR